MSNSQSLVKHSLSYHENLPYAVPLDESKLLLERLKVNFKANYFAGNWISARPWFRQLTNYTDLKYDLSLEDRVFFAEILLGYLVQPEPDLKFVESCSWSLLRLIQKEHRVPNGAFLVDWRKLYHSMKLRLSPKNSLRLDVDMSRMTSYLHVPGITQRFFHPDAAPEIWEEFLPMLDATNVESCMIAQSWIGKFLPTIVNKHTYMSLSMIFRLWPLMNLDVPWDSVWMGLVRMLTRSMALTPKSKIQFDKSWNDYCWTTGCSFLMLPTTLTTNPGLNNERRLSNVYKGLRLPVDSVEAFAGYIVWSFNTTADHDNMQKLRDLINSIELLFHPSNFGAWTPALCRFLRALSNIMLQRINFENEFSSENNDGSSKITNEQRSEFVGILKSPTLASLYVKNSYLASISWMSISYLCWINAEAMREDLLANAYQDFETVTEVQRARSTIAAFAYSARPFFSSINNPKGTKHLFPLLELASLSMDTNDNYKLIACCTFIYNTLSGISLPGENYSYDDDEVYFNTSDWVDLYISKLLYLAENLSESSNAPGQVSKQDSFMITIVALSCDTVLNQLEKNLLDLVFEKIYTFVSTKTVENFDIIGRIVSNLTSLSTEMACKKFLPLFLNEIRYELQHASEHNQYSDKRISYFIRLLYTTVHSMGSSCLSYSKEILSVLNEGLEKCKNKLLLSQFSNIIYGFISSTSNIYLTEYQSFSEKESKENWHKKLDLKNLKVKWHIPTVQEIDFAVNLWCEYMQAGLDSLQTIADQMEITNRENLVVDICKNLVILHACLRNKGNLISIETPKDQSDDKFVLDLEVGVCKLSEAQKLTIQNLKNRCTEFLPLFVTVMERLEIWDVNTIVTLTEVLQDLVNPYHSAKFHRDFIKAHYDIEKTLNRIPVSRKHYSRPLLLRRIRLYQAERVVVKASMIPESDHDDDLLFSLLRLATSPYSIVRRKAQHVLAETVSSRKYLLKNVMLGLIKLLQKDLTKHELKGILYIITHDYIFENGLTKLEYLKDILPLINKHKKTDETKLKELVKNFFKKLSGANLQVLAFPTCVEKSENPELLSSIDKSREKILTKSRLIGENYNYIVDYLCNEIVKETSAFSTLNYSFRILERLCCMQYTPTELTARALIKGLQCDLFPVREGAVDLFCRYMVMIKERSAKREYKLMQEASPWINQLFSADLNDSADMFYDENKIGYIMLPHQLKFYKKQEKFFLLDIEEASKPFYQILKDAFSTKEFWTIFAKNHTVQTHAHDQFSFSNANFYRIVSALFEDCNFEAQFSIYLELLSCQDQIDKFRPGLEWLAGLIRGSKHWNDVQKQLLQEKLTPVIETLLVKINRDSRLIWIKFLEYCLAKRDPNRSSWFINLLEKWIFEEGEHSSFYESLKQSTYYTLLRELGLRYQVRVLKQFQGLVSLMDHPYEQVRLRIGRSLASIIALASITIPQTSNLMVAVKTPSPICLVSLELMIEKISLKDNFTTTKSQETLLAVIDHAIKEINFPIAQRMILEFLPVVFKLTEIKQDQEVQLKTLRVLTRIINLRYGEHTVEVLNILLNLTKDTNWRVRCRVLNCLQIYHAKNMVLLDPWTEQITEISLRGLGENVVEVRNMAANLFCHLVRSMKPTKFKKYQSQLYANLKSDGKEHLVAVLGLGCLIKAYPYYIPSWMPEALTKLSKFVKDPNPSIKGWVKAIFLEFKQTHQDSWVRDKLKFSPEQLDDIRDLLVSPSYYA